MTFDCNERSTSKVTHLTFDPFVYNVRAVKRQVVPFIEMKTLPGWYSRAIGRGSAGISPDAVRCPIGRRRIELGPVERENGIFYAALAYERPIS